MAVVSDLRPEHELEAQLQNRPALAAAFLWSAAALAVFGYWFYLKPLPNWFTVNLFIAAGVSLFASVYHMRLWRSAGDGAVLLQLLITERRFFGLLGLAIGVLLLLGALWIGLTYRLEAFGEALSLGVFSLIAIEGSRRLLSRSQVSLGERLLPALVHARTLIAIALLLLGAALVLIGLWLGFKIKAGFPESAGLLLAGLVAIGGGLYLRMAHEVNARAFVLAMGGLVGLIIAVMVIVRVWLSRDLFLGGVTRWRSEDVWKIWLCAYLELFGLMLMFGSVLAARAEVRVKASMRLVLYGYNSVLTGLLLLAFLVVLDVVVYVLFPLNLDWTASRGLYALSSSSRDILEKLKTPVNVYVLFSPRTKEYREVHNLLENAQTVTEKLNVKYVSPDQDFLEYAALAQKYPELVPAGGASQFDTENGRGVLLVYGTDTEGHKAPHVLIPPRKIVKEDFDPQERRQKKIYLAEASVMTELQYLMEGQKKTKIYILQGDDELDINESRLVDRRGIVIFPMKPLGAGALVDRLKKENFEVSGLSFAPGKDEGSVIHVKEDKDKHKDIPADARAVIIAGPSETFSKETLDALDRYMEKNGRLIITLDVAAKVVNRQLTDLKQSGLEEWLKKYNVDVGAEFVDRLPAREPALLRDPRTVIASAPLESDNPLAKKLRAEDYIFSTVRVVRPGPKADKYQTDVLLEVSPRLAPWAETNVEALVDPVRYAIQSVRDGTRTPSEKPVPIAVTVREGEKPRLVVFGDTEFISNRDLNDSSYNILASALDWLSDRPGVGARPKESSVYALSPAGAEHISRMTNMPAWLMGLAIVGIGTGLWVVRRR